MHEPVEWEEFLERHPQAHILQTREWGELKSSFGWTVEHAIEAEAGAQVLFRRLPLGFTIGYLPLGPTPPTPEALGQLLPRLDEMCVRQRAVLLKVEPDSQDDPRAAERLRAMGFRRSPQTVQPPRTIAVDLLGAEEEILGRMKQKTRYNIRLAQRHGVEVSVSDDIAAFSEMMAVTARRDRFAAHSPDYYRRAYKLFAARGSAELLTAHAADRPLAALMAFARGKRAWYFYGASGDENRQLMPTYLLQWEAMRWAKRRGCSQYDLWGVPDATEAELEAAFARRAGGLWGVYRFKRGFGGTVRRSLGAWDRIYNPALYRAYLVLLRARHAEAL